MNTTIMITIIISFAVLLIIGMIFFLRQKKKNFKLQNIFKNLVRENKLFIHYKDVFSKKLIALDKKNKKLLLLSLNKKELIKMCVNLDKIESCDIVHLKDKYERLPRKVLLELICKSENKPIRFCFYDDSVDNKQDLACLVLKARHWHQRINFHKNYWWINSQEYVL